MKSTLPAVRAGVGELPSRLSAARSIAGRRAVTRRGVNTWEISERMRPWPGGSVRRIELLMESSALSPDVVRATPNPGLRST